MRTGLSLAVVCAMLLGCLLPATAHGELELSITITGPPDELLPLLKRLKRMGVGQPKKAEQSEEPIRVEMHSVSTVDESAPPEPEEPEEKVVELGLWGAAVQPAPAEPGQTAMVTVQIADSEGRIDTVAAALENGDGYLFDLYDNGRNGDEVARDGIWSYELTVPQAMDVDEYKILIIPYNRRGDEVTAETPDGETVSLRAEVLLPVKR